MPNHRRQSDTAPLIRLVAVFSCVAAVVLVVVTAKLGVGRLLRPEQPERWPSDALATFAADLTTPQDTRNAGLPGDGMDRALHTPPGFEMELVYSVPRPGSWVCLTVDDKGRLIASDQSGGLS